MASNEQMKTEFSFFSEVWLFFKRYYEVQNTDSYWDSAIGEANAIDKKYNRELCKDLLISVLGELERKSREIASGEGRPGSEAV